MNIRWACYMLSLMLVPGVVRGESTALSLDQAVSLAIAADPWLSGSSYRQEALMSESMSGATLPDPKISVMAANFPTDSFDLNQEPMTQLSIGVSQMFPRGDSRKLMSRQKQTLAGQEPWLRQDRQARVAATVSQLWLDAFKAQQSIRRIEQDRSLFEHLIGAATASYSSAMGRARQQDIIRAQLELTRLEDRLTVLRQQQQTAEKKLSEWLGAQASVSLIDNAVPEHFSTKPAAMTNLIHNDQWLYQHILRHPALMAFEQRVQAMQTGVELARQKYKPEWGLSAQYGYRDDDLMGRDRADFLSVGLSFDVPLFTANRQDREVNAAISHAEALKTDKLLAARKLKALTETAVVQLARLSERNTLYVEQLMPQMAEQAEAALAAYNNDDGDFAEAIRARIAELNAKIDLLNIQVERMKTIAELRYLLTSADDFQAEG